MDFAGAIKAGFQNYVNFSGVAGRSEYWYWYLFTALSSIVLGVIDQFSSYSILGTLFSLAILVPNLAVQVRRLRDSGHNWKWLIVSFASGILIFVSFIVLFVRTLTVFPNLELMSDNPDPTLVSNQLAVLVTDPIVLMAIIFMLLSLLAGLAIGIVILVFLIQPSMSLEQGNKYLVPKTLEN